MRPSPPNPAKFRADIDAAIQNLYEGVYCGPVKTVGLGGAPCSRVGGSSRSGVGN